MRKLQCVCVSHRNCFLSILKQYYSRKRDRRQLRQLQPPVFACEKRFIEAVNAFPDIYLPL